MTIQPAKPAERYWPSGSKPTAKGVRTLVEGVRTDSDARLCACGCKTALDGKRCDAEYFNPAHRRDHSRRIFYAFLDRFAPGWQPAWEAEGHTIRRD
jgi:hypothetical protein